MRTVRLLVPLLLLPAVDCTITPEPASAPSILSDVVYVMVIGDEPALLVLDNFEQLFDAGYNTDFAPLYARYANEPPIRADEVIEGDRVVG